MFKKDYNILLHWLAWGPYAYVPPGQLQLILASASNKVVIHRQGWRPLLKMAVTILSSSFSSFYPFQFAVPHFQLFPGAHPFGDGALLWTKFWGVGHFQLEFLECPDFHDTDSGCASSIEEHICDIWLLWLYKRNRCCKTMCMLVFSGGWSTKGCEVVSVDGLKVSCSCSHLTNFAILFSPKPAVSFCF